MNNLTEIAFILDRSGSMQSIAEAAVNSFNELLARQQAEHDQTPVKMSLVLFNAEYEVPFASVNAPELPRLHMATYAPDGGTALLDAIGRTIDELGLRLAAMSDTDRPGKVILAIMTDGEENSSRIFNWEQISEKIRHQQDVYKWEFLFLGANQDAIATAGRMNICASKSANFYSTDAGMRKSMRGVEQNFFETKHRVSEPTPLSQLVEEADDKE
ncbi:MAG: VWA domain-containing protein [Verrucomicrobia bacterium]|nr:VWA domain-containing protein [Verrucomicrobiota bacterium]